MSTSVRSRPSATVNSQLLPELHIALDALAKDLAPQIIALVCTQLGTPKPTRKVGATTLAESVPVLVKQAFVTSFLSGGKRARENRAFLSHALATAELEATVSSNRAKLLPTVDRSEHAAKAAEDEELTSEAASKLLHVSRTHVNTLADSGVLGIVRRTDGGHRRIPKAALLRYKAMSQERQSAGLDAMVAASQKLGLYDAELEGLPVNAGS